MQRSVRKYFWLFVLPLFLAFTVVFLVPFVMGVYLSFCKFTTVTNATWVGFANYVKAFTLGKDFVNALWFTVKFTLVSVVTINLFAFALAMILTKNIRGTNLFRTVYFMPNLIGGIVLGWIWQMIFNGVLRPYNLTLTSNPTFGFWGLVILMNWQMIGYMMVIYIAGIQSIPGDLYDAADVDGAGWWCRLRNVTIPMVMPSITICTFLTLTNSFKLFDQNLALTAGAPSKKTAMLALDIYNSFYTRTNFEGVGQAKAVVFFLIVAIISLIQLSLTRSKEVDQ